MKGCNVPTNPHTFPVAVLIPTLSLLCSDCLRADWELASYRVPGLLVVGSDPTLLDACKCLNVYPMLYIL